MSLYETLRNENKRQFRIRVEANIDPCENCIVEFSEGSEHCRDCLVKIDKKRYLRLKNGY